MLRLAFYCLIAALAFVEGATVEELETTRVFVLTIDPKSFNWTTGFSRQGYWFRPSLVDSPDLPSWLSYIFSERYRSGYLYGVPPHLPNLYSIEIIGVNKQTYETQRKLVGLNVTQKLNPARYQVQVKIDNVNVEDMLDRGRLNNLMQVFTKVLWPQSQDDLYLTFIDSAIKMGARKPLRPNDSDGVVLRLGSGAEFSKELLDLQSEVRPLLKLSSCPRDFKRTTVDRHFRAGSFALDWCSFRLEGEERKRAGGEGRREEESWTPVTREKLSRRSYQNDLLATLLLPSTILLIMALLLSLILCFHHERLKEECEESEETLTQYEAVQRATTSLRSLSTVRDPSPRLGGESADAGRPNPPPYTAVRRNVHLEDS